jgi:hypothetical protein
MNDLESRLRASLHTHGTVAPVTMPSGTSARVRARRFATAAGTCAVLAVFAIGAAWAIPHGDRPSSQTPADGPTDGVVIPSAPPGWPTVVAGDPSTAYTDLQGIAHVVGDGHLLTSGTVDGAEFSLMGYSVQEDGLQVCLQMAGPASDGPPVSPGPQPPTAGAASGGVGGFCLTERMPTELVDVGWPDFPTTVDLFARTWEGPKPEYVGFVTDRVQRLEVHLADGSVLDVPLRSFPNSQRTSAFVLFPPSQAIDGTLVALDGDGTVLATATFCRPGDDGDSCGILPTDQRAPVTGGEG